MSGNNSKTPLFYEDPSFLKDKTYPELSAICKDIRTEIIRICSEYGGHLSPNLGDVELTVALHRQFDFKRDKLIFDVGHQCYAHKILTGRSLEHLNEKDHVAGFQKVAESVYDPWEAGHSSTSISAAQAFAYARDQKKEKFDVVAFIGDSSIVNGLSFEALNNVGAHNNKVIVILNDNDMSISQPVGALGNFFRKISTGKAYNTFKRGYRNVLFRSKVGHKIYDWSSAFKNKIKRKLIASNIFDNLGFNYIGPVDGHDIKALEKALIRAKRSTKSVVLHAITVKGRGYSYAEKDKTGYWHGVTPFDIETGQPKNFHPGKISWSHFFADLTEEIMKEKPYAQLIVPATRKGSGLEKVFSAYEERCHDVGIAEEHAATLCGGLYMNGYHPILSIYSTFMQRCYDELSHDCARMKANMTVLVDRAGMVGKNGDTHQGIYDVAYMKTIPNTVITMPSTKAIAKALYYQSFDKHGLFVIRYPREMVSETEDYFHVDLPYLRWRYEGLTTTKKVAVVVVGPRERDMVEEVKKRYLDVEIIDPVYLYPLQEDNLLPLLQYENIVLYDCYGTKEGFADSVCSSLLSLGYKGKVLVRAIPNVFVPQAKSSEQLGQFGLLPEQICLELETLLKK